MHSTKTEILAHLKRNDGATVDGIASSLNLAPMTVRQHLVALERDGAVRAEEVRRATGRPHFRYVLTDDGHRRLSDGYDRLLALLVEQAGLVTPNGERSPQDRRDHLFRSTAEALAQRHAGEARGLAPSAQAELAVAVLRKHGGFAEYHDLGDDIEIRDFGCVYREIVTRTGPCAWHDAFLASMLDAEVRAAPEAPSGCAVCCRYVIAARVTAAGAGLERTSVGVRTTR